jgi:hypothetical protein
VQLHLVVKRRPKVASIMLDYGVVERLASMPWRMKMQISLPETVKSLVKAFLPSAKVEIERLRIVDE